MRASRLKKHKYNGGLQVTRKCHNHKKPKITKQGCMNNIDKCSNISAAVLCSDLQREVFATFSIS